MLTILTFLSTAMVFLFQNYQPANRINANAADQQQVVGDEWPWYAWLIIPAVIAIIGFAIWKMPKRVPGKGYINDNSKRGGDGGMNVS